MVDNGIIWALAGDLPDCLDPRGRLGASKVELEQRRTAGGGGRIDAGAGEAVASGTAKNGRRRNVTREVAAPHVNAAGLSRRGTRRNVSERTADHTAGRYGQRWITGEERRHQERLR